MRVTKVPYSVYENTVYSDRQFVRQFHRWDAWAATKDGRLLILLDEYARRQATVCEYDTEREREEDLRVLQTMPDAAPASRGGTGGSSGTPPPAVAALPIPQPLPQESDEEPPIRTEKIEPEVTKGKRR